MDLSALMARLEQRNEVSSNCQAWLACCSITNTLVSKLAELDTFSIEVSSLVAETKALEEEVNSNTEYARLSREINEREKNNSELMRTKETLIMSEKALKEELQIIEQKYAPVQAEANVWKGKTEDLAKAVHHLADDLSRRNVEFTGAKEAFDAMSAQIARLSVEETQLIPKLLQLREREADLRNNKTEQRTTAPVDVEAMQCPIPKVKGSEVYHDDPGVEELEDADLLQKLKQGNTSQRHSGPVTCICYSSTQPYVATGGEDSVVNVIRTDNYRRIAQICDAKRSIMALAFSPLDQFLLTASHDTSIRFYKLPSMTLVYNNSDNRDCVTDAKFITDDKYISCCRDHTIKLFDINRSTPISNFTSSSIPYSICALQGESLVVTAHHDGKLRSWDFRTHGTPTELKVHKTNIIQVIGSHGSSKLVSLGADKMIVVSDIKAGSVTGKVNISKSGMPSENMQMALYEDRAIIGGTTGEIFDYDLTTFTLVRSTKGHTNPVFCVAVKRTIGLMATGDRSGVVKFWNK